MRTIPGWLDGLINSISVLGISKSIKDAIINDSDNLYMNDIARLTKQYNALLDKLGSEEAAMSAIIDRVIASSLPIPGEASRKLNELKDKLMKQQSGLSNDMERVARERDARINLASSADSLARTNENLDWYNKQQSSYENNNLIGDINEKYKLQKKEEL